MNEFALLAGLIALLVVIVFFVVILERQGRKNNELISFLVGQFREISSSQNQTHQFQMDSMIAANMSQADRHQRAVDSFLGLIDELSANANPGKVSARQYKQYEQYLVEQARK
jgi:hypothetical protein